MTSGTNRLFQIYQPGFSRHYDITTAENRQIFYAEVSSFTPSKPDITLRAGANKTSPTVAACRFPKFSRTFTVGLGDPAANSCAMQWENMSSDSTWSTQFRWNMNIPSLGGQRSGFVWKHTRNVAVDGKHVSVCSSLNYKMVDAQTNRPVAVFTSTTSFDKLGTLQINVNYGKEFDTMTILTLLSIYVKARRSQAANAAGSSGGGGGGGG